MSTARQEPSQRPVPLTKQLAITWPHTGATIQLVRSAGQLATTNRMFYFARFSIIERDQILRGPRLPPSAQAIGTAAKCFHFLLSSFRTSAIP